MIHISYNRDKSDLQLSVAVWGSSFLAFFTDVTTTSSSRCPSLQNKSNNFSNCVYHWILVFNTIIIYRFDIRVRAREHVQLQRSRGMVNFRLYIDSIILVKLTTTFPFLENHLDLNVWKDHWICLKIFKYMYNCNLLCFKIIQLAFWEYIIYP